MKWNLSDTKNFRCKKAVTVLALVALGCIALSVLPYEIGRFLWDAIYESRIYFGILLVPLIMAPYVLLVLYVLKFHGTEKEVFFIPAVFGVLAVYQLNSLIWILTDGGFSFIYLLMFVLFALATVGVLTGFGKKAFPITAVCVELILVLRSLYFTVRFIRWQLPYMGRPNLFSSEIWTWGSYSGTNDLLDCIAYGCLLASLLIFMLKNKFRNPPEQKVDYAQALRTLKENYESGAITEEEYQSHRAEIIGKL